MRKTALLFLALMVSAACSKQRAQLEVIYENNMGLVSLAQQNNSEALERLTQAMVLEPFDPRIQMNLGLAYEAQEDFERAYQSYALVLQVYNLPPQMEFQALFNMARVRGFQGEIESALDLYQQALKIDPLSQEVKHNIELLLAGGGESGSDEGEDEGGDGEGEPDLPQQPDQEEPPEPEEMSPEDVERILEELNRQEKNIRAKEMEQKAGEPQSGKNW